MNEGALYMMKTTLASQPVALLAASPPASFGRQAEGGAGAPRVHCVNASLGSSACLNVNSGSGINFIAQ